MTGYGVHVEATLWHSAAFIDACFEHNMQDQNKIKISHSVATSCPVSLKNECKAQKLFQHSSDAETSNHSAVQCIHSSVFTR